MKSDVNSFLDEFIKKSLGNQYVIPVYQRNYTWNKKHVNQLLSDVRKLLQGKKEYHFLGTIVYSVKLGNEVTEREIVDGQQRLTTMFLMLYALKSIANEIGDGSYAGRLTEEYLENKYVDDKYKLRLKPLVSDDNIYQLIAENDIKIIEENEQNKNSKVYVNYLTIRDEFKKWLDEEHTDLASIVKALDKLKIVYIQIDQSDDAQSIFESINSTGETLTSADLIRNYILMNKSNNIQEEYYKNYWLKLEKYLNEDSKKIAEFLRVYLASKTFNLCNQNAIYEYFKIYWQSSNETEENRLQDIVQYAKYYYELYYANVDEIRLAPEAVKDLRRIKSNLPAPFLMKMMELCDKGVINVDTFEDILTKINIYMIRRHMMKLDTSDITRLFPQLLRKVISLCEQYSYNEIIEIFKKCLVNDNRQKSAFMPDDNQMISYLNKANAYSLVHTRFILDKIENLGNTAPVDLSNLSVEHIMPQTPNSYWIKYTNGDKLEYDIQVNRLGNLTLVSKPDNSEAGNKDFETKKKVMDDTRHIRLNAEIIEKPEWNVHEIDERTTSLTKSFLLAFPYSSSEKEYFDKESEQRIYLDYDGFNAEAILKETGEIEVDSGSGVNIEIEPGSYKNKMIRKSLIEEGIIAQLPDDGEWIFVEKYIFKNLNEATNVILGKSHSGKFLWKDEKGVVLNEKGNIATEDDDEQIEIEE